MDNTVQQEFLERVWPIAQTIPGWLAPSEAAALFVLARSLPRFANVVEIGSYMGKSSVILALGVKPNDGKVYCVDPFDQPYMDAVASRLHTFEKNMRDAGVDSVVRPINDYSSRAALRWGAGIDLLFIDGDHEYNAVKMDVTLWTPFLLDGTGILTMHDVDLPGDPWPKRDDGPGKVVQELILYGQWKNTQRVHRLYIATKKKGC